jgi:hypothetical protein
MKKNIAALILFGVSFSVQSQNLNELFHPKTIGLNKEYLEKITGPAQRVLDNVHQYEINKKCHIHIQYSNNSVQSIAIRHISKECSFDAKNIYLNGPIENVTFGDIMGIIAVWKAYESCIGLCGNSHAPVHQMWAETPRAMSYGPIKFIVGTTNSEPAFNMRDDILKMYTNLSPIDFSGGYLGTKIQWQPYFHYWIKNFKNEKITSIQIGSNLK